MGKTLPLPAGPALSQREFHPYSGTWDDADCRLLGAAGGGARHRLKGMVHCLHLMAKDGSSRGATIEMNGIVVQAMLPYEG